MKCRIRTFNLLIDNDILQMTLNIVNNFKNNTFSGVLDDEMRDKYKCGLVNKGFLN